MRVLASCIAVAVCAACGPSTAEPPPSQSPVPQSMPPSVDPARVDRVRSRVPTGYEFARLSGRAAPATSWGLGQDPVADPAPCGVLANPAGDADVRGWSASGPGGIVYAVVADAAVGLDPAVRDACATWTLAAGHTDGVVRLIDAPVIDGAATLGMAADATTVVEGGTETHSHADTFVAYLADHVAHVTVVTDPGSSAPGLEPGFAAELLVETVAAIRG